MLLLPHHISPHLSKPYRPYRHWSDLKSAWLCGNFFNFAGNYKLLNYQLGWCFRKDKDCLASIELEEKDC